MDMLDLNTEVLPQGGGQHLSLKVQQIIYVASVNNCCPSQYAAQQIKV